MRSIGVALALLVLAVGCGSDLPRLDSAELTAARAQWESKAPDVYMVWYEGDVGGTERSDMIRVDRQHQARDIHSPLAVDELFEAMSTHIDAGQTVRVEFDPDVGYPVRLEAPGLDIHSKGFGGGDRIEGCTEVEADGPLDVRAESFERVLNADYYDRWSDSEQCPVRTDVLTSFPGDGDHCDWEEMEYLVFGNPLGAPADQEGERWYIRDQLDLLGGFDDVDRGRVLPVVELPEGVTDTGYRRGDAELWFGEAHHDRAYLVIGDEAFEFVADPDKVIGCE